MVDTVQTDHTYNFNVNNTILIITDKTYAGCFRKFWSNFMNYDLDRTVKAILNFLSLKTVQKEKYPSQRRLLDLHTFKSPGNGHKIPSRMEPRTRKNGVTNK